MFYVSSAVHASTGVRFSWFPFLWSGIFNLTNTVVFGIQSANTGYSSLLIATTSLAAATVMYARLFVCFCFCSLKQSLLFSLAIGCMIVAVKTQKALLAVESVRMISLPKVYIAFFVLAMLGSSFLTSAFAIQVRSKKMCEIFIDFLLVTIGGSRKCGSWNFGPANVFDYL